MTMDGVPLVSRQPLSDGCLAKFLAPFDLTQFLATKEYSDVTLIASDGDVRCHSLLLGATCPLLRRLLQKDENEGENVIALPDFTAKNLEILMEIIYGVEVPDVGDHLDDLKGLVNVLECEWMPVLTDGSLSVVEVERKVSIKQAMDLLEDFDLDNGVVENDDDDDDELYVPEIDIGYGRKIRQDDDERFLSEEQVQDKENLVGKSLPEDENGAFMCPVLHCKMSYKHSKRDQVMTHIETVHRKVQCPHCVKKMTVRYLNMHIKRVHKDLLDENDDDDSEGDHKVEPWMTDDSLVTEEQVQNKKNFKWKQFPEDKETGMFMCPVIPCKAGYLSFKRELIINHIETTHRKVGCPHCKAKMTSKYLARHIQRVHRDRTDGTDDDDEQPNEKKLKVELAEEEEEEELEDLTCEDKDCSYQTQTRDDLSDHVSEVHEGRSLCLKCCKILPDDEIDDHFVHCDNDTSKSRRGDKAVNSYGCMECGDASFKTYLDIHQHRRQAHNNKDFNILCRQCGLILRHKYQIKTHGEKCRSKEWEAKAPEAKDKPSEAAKFEPHPTDPSQCSKCSFRSDKSYKLIKHYREYHVKLPCPHCNKLYSYYHLDRHIKTMHTNDLEYQCEICSMRFYRERYLKHHIDEVHVRQLSYVCEVCGEAHYSQGALSKHKTKAHNRTRHFPCKLCDKVYLNNASLKKHMNRHHSGNSETKEVMAKKSTVPVPVPVVQPSKVVPPQHLQPHQPQMAATASAAAASALAAMTVNPYLQPHQFLLPQDGTGGYMKSEYSG